MSVTQQYTTFSDLRHSASIYALCEPSGEIRYVGKAIDPVRRLSEHMRPCALRANTHKVNWLKSLASSGQKPILKILESVSAANAGQREIFWINYLSKNFNLTNTAEGGFGGNIGVHGHKKQALALKGRKVFRSYDHSHKLVQANKLRAKNPEWRRKIAEAAKARSVRDREQLMENLKVAWFAPRTKRYERICIGCGSPFIAKNTRKKYCKSQCRTDSWKRNNKVNQQEFTQ